MNNLTMTKKADSDCCVDETTWGFSGYMAEVGGRLMNKKVDKGGQTTMIFDISNRYPRGYVHSS
ncbi:hypothetical protein QTG54_014107 [Skeletonema marinoi]|uniref:Uncharacterized protein n=1 Tax=Skeletonema marinoi TaxID=267567 RepID=A0AAD9D5P8_9STRA|nr:hypothetical protein QTG54_014107 [Skeletonema marinoi]